MGSGRKSFLTQKKTLVRHDKPDSPRRNKIQSYVQRVLNPTNDPSRISDVTQAISSAYSGYVHASAPQVLDLYGGEPPHFHIEGMQGTPRMDDHVHDAWNYYYRAIVAAVLVSRAFGDAHLSKSLGDYHDKFLEQSGTRGEQVRPVAGAEPRIRGFHNQAS